MCAITGMVSLKPIDRENFQMMNLAASHRGPDGDGFFFDQNVALGHRRLAIIDLSNGGRQPMQKYGLQITYNGEIYNYKELRQELESLGHAFTSESDTEVLLTAYSQWGQDCLTKLNGMWSFCIYNPQQKTIFCSRDRFGVKPFYYTLTNDTFIFASEIKQILSYENIKKELNKSAVSKYLISSLLENSEETFFANIKKLQPGHLLKFNVSDFKLEIERYYHPQFTNTHFNSEDFADLLKDSVKLRMRSDTPVGSCLSGGLDSSLIVSIASRLPVKGRFQTFTAIPYDKKFDESAFVKKLAEDLPILPHYTTPQISDFHHELQNVIRLQEEPFISPSIFMQYFVMKKAHETGLKVLLDGQGADEILLGYEKYFPAMLTKMALTQPGLCFKTLMDLIKKNENVSALFLLKTKVKSWLKDQRSPQVLALKNVTADEFTHDSSSSSINLNSRDYNRYRMDDLTQNNLPALLRYEDKNSMHFGIETRLPYLDFRVVDAALKIPLQDLFVDGLAKAPLRNLFSDLLPPYIGQRRSKFNFNAPENIWSETADDLIHKSPSSSYFFKNNLDLKKLSGIHPWKVLNLCLWHDQYFY